MKTNTFFSLVSLFLYFSFLSWAQNDKKLDSLQKLYNYGQENLQQLGTIDKLFRLTLSNDNEQSSIYVKEHLALSQQLKNPYHIAKSNHNFGSYLNHLGKKDSALIYLYKSQELWKKNRNPTEMLKTSSDIASVLYHLGKTDEALTMINKNLKLHDSINKISTSWANDHRIKGNIYQSFSDYPKALENFLAAERIYALANDEAQQALALDDIGYLENLMGNFDKATEYTQKAAVIYKKNDNKSMLARAYQTLGIISVMTGDREKASSHFKESLPIAKASGSKSIEAKAYDYLGGILVEAGNFKEGIPFLEKCLELQQEIGHKQAISHILINLGLAYHDMKNFRKAIDYFNQAKIVSESMDNNTALINKVYQYRFESYEAMNDIANAFKDLKSFKAMNDTLLNIEKSKQIEEMRAIFDTEKKEQKIAQQETEISLLEEKEKTSRLQKIALGGGLGLSAIALGFGFYGFRQKTKRNRLEKEKVETELEFKKKELTTHALQLAKKNETLENLKQKAKELKSSEVHNGYQQLITAINFDLQDDNNWENFSRYFEEVHKDFNSNVTNRYSDITPNELRLMALLKMNLSSKEIANILNISSNGIKKARQRLRKKMHLSITESLESAVLSI